MDKKPNMKDFSLIINGQKNDSYLAVLQRGSHANSQQ